MHYLTCAQAAFKWDISVRRVQTLCKEGRIPGTVRFGRSYVIPASAKKPKDARIKSGKYIGSRKYRAKD